MLPSALTPAMRPSDPAPAVGLAEPDALAGAQADLLERAIVSRHALIVSRSAIRACSLRMPASQRS